MQPEISVVIPAYNVRNYIKNCLDPILIFHDIEIEIIVVNDGSTDDTLEILKSCEDKRLRIISHEVNKGLPAARNTGFCASTGKYILPLDSDDIPIPQNWISLLSLIKEDDNAVLAYGLLQRFNDGEKFNPGCTSKSFKPSGDVLSKIIIGHVPISVGTALINREAILNAGLWNEDLTIGEDFEMWCRLAAIGTFLHKSIVVVGYRQRQSSMTKSKLNLDEAKLRKPVELIFENPVIIAKLGVQFNDIKNTAFSNFHYRFAAKSFLFKCYTNAIKHFFYSFVLRPQKVIYLLKYPIRLCLRNIIK